MQWYCCDSLFQLTGRCVVQGSDSATADFSTQVTRIRALGFNAVKLPFSFSTLLGAALAPVSTACTTATPAQLQVSTYTAPILQRLALSSASLCCTCC